MEKIKALLILATALCPVSAAAIPQPSPMELDPEFLAGIHDLFPESQEVAPRLLDFNVDPNLRLFREAEIRLTFIDEGAEYRNSVGYFLYEDSDRDGAIAESEILKREMLFPNASKEGSGGNLKAGDTLSLGRFPAGTRLGFFLIADGADSAKETYYTVDGLNPDGERHLAMLALPDRENVILGIEDLPRGRSDRDFNDLLFTFTTDPKSALQEVIEDSEIPVASGPPISNPPASPAADPLATEEPSEVSLQQTKGPAVLEGSGLGCQVGGSGRVQGGSFIFWGAFLVWLFRHWTRHS